MTMTRTIAAIGMAGALLVSGCGDSDDEDSSGGDGSEESSTTSTSSTSTTTEPESGVDAALVGQWTADAGDTLAANMTNLGMPPGIGCSGPQTLTFNEDGTFSAGGTATCSAGAMSITATMNTTGSWAVGDDGQIEISGTLSEGSFDVPGIEIPPIDVVSEGEFDYVIEGAILSITFTDPNTGTVTQMWTRA